MSLDRDARVVRQAASWSTALTPPPAASGGWARFTDCPRVQLPRTVMITALPAPPCRQRRLYAAMSPGGRMSGRAPIRVSFHSSGLWDSQLPMIDVVQAPTGLWAVKCRDNAESLRWMRYDSSRCVKPEASRSSRNRPASTPLFAAPPAARPATSREPPPLALSPPYTAGHYDRRPKLMISQERLPAPRKPSPSGSHRPARCPVVRSRHWNGCTLLLSEAVDQRESR
jgi:hypothetical protein